jgi:TolB protein
MPAHMFKPVFSPDGQKVAVTFWLHDHWEIYTVDAASGALTRLTTGHPYNERTASSAAPAWSPDSKQLLFLTNRSGQWQPWIMDADGRNAHPFLPPETIAGLEFEYRGVHEQLFSWR